MATLTFKVAEDLEDSLTELLRVLYFFQILDSIALVALENLTFIIFDEGPSIGCCCLDRVELIDPVLDAVREQLYNVVEIVKPKTGILHSNLLLNKINGSNRTNSQ